MRTKNNSNAYFALALSALLTTACTTAPDGGNTASSNTKSANVATAQDQSQQALALFDTFFEEDLARSPIEQTYLGIKTDYDKWDDYSEAYGEETHRLKQDQLARLNKIDATQLNASAALSFRLQKQALEHNIADYQWRYHNYPVNQMFGVHTMAPSLLINQHSIGNKQEARAYINRLITLPKMFDQLIEGLKTRADKGIIAPKFAFPHAITASRSIIAGAPFTQGDDSTLYADFKHKVEALNIAKKDKRELISAAEVALKQQVKPSYDKLIGYLQTLEKRADTRDGAWKFPDGAVFYNNALARTTTTSMSAADIHSIGLAEVARIHGEMRAIMAKVEFKGDLQDFFEFLRTDKQFRYSETEQSREDYLAEAKAIIDNMQARLDELFITKPKAALKVQRVEAFREKSAGKAFYQQPSMDGSRPGLYYANLYKMSDMPIYQMEALAYHEGIPGHHMQVAIAQELTEIPKFRKFGRYTAYTEGWGLYSELIPKEMGLYQDPYSDFGRLAMELWRACRLVVDTGIHAKKWTREEAIDYLKKNTPNPENDVVKAIERYIVMPSQATAYKIGMLKIQQLRRDAEKRLGDKFDVRYFHDVVLGNGAVPLDVLEDLVNTWVEQQVSS